MAGRMESITIRLPTELFRALDGRAQARRLTRAGYLRSIVVDALEDADRDERRRTLEALAQSVHDLRQKLGRATVAILADLQTTTKERKEARLTKDEINTWVSNNILR